MDKQREVLVVRGYLDRAGLFTLRRSRSTSYVRQWPVVEKSDVVIELLDADHRILHREPVQVTRDTTCEPGASLRFRVLAYIGLRPEAVIVRLRRGDIDIWHSGIPDAPWVRVRLPRKRIGEDRRIVLALEFSAPSEVAHLTVVYKWGPRQFRPVYIGPPRNEIELDLSDMPGGDACQVVVSYSNGLRSEQAATEPFRVPARAPVAAIHKPGSRDVIGAGTPVILEGSVRDDQRAGGPDYEALVWLVDEREVGRGLIASIDGLEAGRHKLMLQYRADPGASAAHTITVRPGNEAPSANEWQEWDFVSGNN